jgi:hypothetical protein
MKTKTKKPEKMKEVEPMEVAEDQSAPSIESRVKEFVGKVPMLSKIDIHHIKSEFYRVNVWTKWFSPDRIVPSNRIEHSFFLQITDDSIVNKTLRK